MIKFLFLFLTVNTLIYGHHGGEHIEWNTMYSLPQNSVDQHFESIAEAVKYRWNLLGSNKEFPFYKWGKNEETINAEFHKLNEERLNLWFENKEGLPYQSHPLFKISQEHLIHGRFRQPQCISFEHSVTDTSYNSTCIQVGNRRFFALEGPLEAHVSPFFRLLANWNVKTLACLTDEKDDKGTPKCFPYWKNRIVTKDHESFLQIPVVGELGEPETKRIKELPYIFWPEWEDHHGVDPEKLAKAANRARENAKENEIIAVHCSAGVGRTGTFISAVCILDAIDDQLSKGVTSEKIELNIAKLFYYLNFHRPWLVAKAPQYLTLYRMADWYIKNYESL